ncbi:MAG: glycosyltransferase family 4 protein [Candidatus Harrisonbacteria bacterium]|nr:glycosyltransferase family 4 protein [Candidatus Harrisonbacteria bacterium]
MKILITTGVYPPEIGGPATYTKLMEARLPQYGIEVEPLPFSLVRKWPKGIRHILFFFKVLSRGRDKDLLYAQDTVSVGLPTMLAAKFLRKPFLIRVPGDYAWEQSSQRYGVRDTIDEFQKKQYGFRVELLRSVQRFVARRANALITPSEYFKDLVSGWVKKPERVRRIYNGIDLPQIQFDEGRVKKQSLFSAGRLVPWKGFDFLIRLMKDLPDWTLTIAGDGPQRDSLQELIQEEQLESRVRLLGRIERNELMQEIAEAEIFVLNTSFESFSFQIVEAMHLGRPLIATNIGNLSEIVEDGKDGILVEPNNKEAFLAAMKRISSDPELRKSMQEQARKKAQHFSIDRSVESTAQLIQQFR